MGIKALVVVLICLLFIPSLYRSFQKDKAFDLQPYATSLAAFDSLAVRLERAQGGGRDTLSRSPRENPRATEADRPSATARDIPPPPPIDINRADSAGMQQIRGVGPVFARRITRYRALLGGFVSAEQLLEVYGMDSSRWEGLIPQILIDPSGIEKIRINQANFADLIRHPYIDRKLTIALLNYRRQHGPFREVADIKGSHLICDSVYHRLTPYLCTADD